jgi:hypothetical protein
VLVIVSGYGDFGILVLCNGLSITVTAFSYTWEGSIHGGTEHDHWGRCSGVLIKLGYSQVCENWHKILNCRISMTHRPDDGGSRHLWNVGEVKQCCNSEEPSSYSPPPNLNSHLEIDSSVIAHNEIKNMWYVAIVSSQNRFGMRLGRQKGVCRILQQSVLFRTSTQALVSDPVSRLTADWTAGTALNICIIPAHFGEWLRVSSIIIPSGVLGVTRQFFTHLLYRSQKFETCTISRCCVYPTFFCVCILLGGKEPNRTKFSSR